MHELFEVVFEDIPNEKVIFCLKHFMQNSNKIDISSISEMNLIHEDKSLNLELLEKYIQEKKIFLLLLAFKKLN